jgi:hypothetical protein
MPTMGKALFPRLARLDDTALDAREAGLADFRLAFMAYSPSDPQRSQSPFSSSHAWAGGHSPPTGPTAYLPQVYPCPVITVKG